MDNFKNGFKVNLQLWLRLGDNAEYEDCGQDLDDALAALKDVNTGRVLSWVMHGFTTEQFRGNDYISLYWGDGDGNAERELSPEERQQVEDALAHGSSNLAGPRPNERLSSSRQAVRQMVDRCMREATAIKPAGETKKGTPFYKVVGKLSLPEEANPRYDEPNPDAPDPNNLRHGFGRVIGGDQGDLLFDGYTIENGETVLYNPHVLTGLDMVDWTDDDLFSLAQEILMTSYDSIGVECVEHN